MVWLHGGGFSTGSGSSPHLDGTSLAHTHDVVLVTINHRLNVFGFTYLGEAMGSEFALSGCVGMLDIVAALEWVRDNIDALRRRSAIWSRFRTVGRRPESRDADVDARRQGPVPPRHHRERRRAAADRTKMRCTTRELLLGELGLKAGQVRELQAVPVARLLAANAAVQKKITVREPGMTPNSPMVDGKAMPGHPWDPAGPALSADIPLLIGWAHTEETLYDRPTPEKLALDEAGLQRARRKASRRRPDAVIEAFRKAHPEATPWDLWILIATDHPRGTYTRELAKRKAAQRGAPAFLYRFDWETPEGGGHMRSPHTIEIQFVFNNIKIAGPLISKMPEAYALADKNQRGVGGVRAHRRSQHAEAAEVAGLFRHDRATRCCSTTSAGWSQIPLAARGSRWSRS